MESDLIHDPIIMQFELFHHSPTTPSWTACMGLSIDKILTYDSVGPLSDPVQLLIVPHRATRKDGKVVHPHSFSMYGTMDRKLCFSSGIMQSKNQLDLIDYIVHQSFTRHDCMNG